MTVKQQHNFSKQWACSWFEGTEYIERIIHEEQLTDTDPNTIYQEDERPNPIGFKTSNSQD